MSQLKVLVIVLLMLATTQAEAEEPESFDVYLQRYNLLHQKYYQYMYDRRVEIIDNYVRVSFRWSQTDIFKAGDEFEISVAIAPKSFAKPASGNDHILQGDIDHNFECGFRDIFQYDIPWDSGYRADLIINQCEEFGVEFSTDQKEWIKQISGYYLPIFADKVAVFGVGSTCPEQFKVGKEYYYEYYTKPLPTNEVPGGESECQNDPNFHPEWGYSWLSSKIQPDTLHQKYGALTISDCPYLIGLKDTPANWANQSPPAILANRICATTSELLLPIQDPEGRGWKNKSEWQSSCRDCDGDMLYDTDFAVSMYGSRAVDCNDQCAEVNVCLEGACNSTDFCSEQCGGSGCEEYSVISCSFADPQQCPDESPCVSGETDSENCWTILQERTRTCLGNCQWGDWGSCEWKDLVACTDCPIETEQCENPDCNPGETKSQGCGTGGTQTAACGEDCQWDSWSACQNGCSCAGGECCDGCNYISSATSCDLSYEFQCEGSSQGQNVQRRQVLQYCTGFDAGCSGSFNFGSWQTWEDCSSSQECDYVSGSPVCVGSCQDTFLASSSSVCFNNPQGSGNPTLCLYVQQNNGSSWQYQICKNGGAFQQDFTYRLKDDNYGVSYTQYSASAGTQCTPWRNFSVGQISGYGAINGAGLNGYVSSPAGCSQAACQYNTGGITIRLECQ